MVEYRVKDLGLADQGSLKIEWAEKHMPVLMKLREESVTRRELSGLTIGAVL
ncbi:MAG: adenosylhomocysteinase, partial [Desulfurococcaceae archaeon]